MLLLTGLSLCGCIRQADLKALETRLGKKIEDSERTLRADYNRQLRDTWELVLCSPEARHLLRSVKSLKDCSYTAGKLDGACTSADLSGLVFDTDPKHEGRLLALFGSQRRVPFYFAPGGEVLAKVRQRALQSMLEDKLLAATSFLVVSHPDARDGPPQAQEAGAKTRALVVINEILNHRISPDRILVWLYSFPISRTALGAFPLDLPGRGEPNQVERSVWVFRVDC